MFCKTCNYALWNIRGRLCPECGSPFKPSDFRFVPGAVRFCCPHCSQAYYGTTADGHLDPRAFPCVNCRQPVDMDATIVLPAEGVDESRTTAERMPWLDNTRGFLSRFFGTLGWSMTKPAKLIDGVAPDSSLWRAGWFAFLAMFFYMVVAALPWCGISGFGMLSAPRGSIAAFSTFAIFPLGGLVILFIALTIWALVSHLLLCLGGSTEGGLRRTLQCFFYSAGAFILVAIPCVGLYFAPLCWVWAAISCTIMLSRGQRVGGGRASFATLTPPILLVALGTIWVFTTVVPFFKSSFAAARASAGASAASQGMPSALSTQNVQEVLDALRKHADKPPLHAARLVAWGDVTPAQFMLTQNGRGADMVRVAHASLADLYTATATVQERELAAAEAELPAHVIAHRVGDVVFTYHGVDMDKGDPNLWLLIAEEVISPLQVPGAPPTPQPPAATSIWFVGTLDGRVQHITDIDAATDRQNRLRAAAGLPPLPHITRIGAHWPVGDAAAPPVEKR